MALNTQVSIVDFLKGQGQPSSFSARRQLFQEQGLNQRLGNFVGSGQQNTALLNILQRQGQDQTSIPSIAPQQLQTLAPTQTLVPQADEIGGTPTLPKPPSGQQQDAGSFPIQTQGQAPPELVEQFKKIQQQAAALGQRIQTEGVTGAQGQTLIPPQQQPEIQQPEPNGDTLPDAEPEPQPGSTSSPMDAGEVVQNVALEDTDIGNILQDFTSGDLTTVETTVAQEAKTLLLEGEERRATAAMSQLQKQLAKSGMTFSGIRTQAEETAVAESLAQKAGISNNFATALIRAARQEQSRRENANKEAQKAQTDALLSQGYVKIGDQLFPTLAREKQEEQAEERAAEAPETIGNAQTGSFKWDPDLQKFTQVIPPANKAASSFTPQEIDDAAKSIIDRSADIRNWPLEVRGKINSRMRQIKDNGYAPKWLIERVNDKQITNITDFDVTVASWERVKDLVGDLEGQFGPTVISAYDGSMTSFIRQFAKTPKFAVAFAEIEKAFQLYRKETTGAQASDKEIARLRPLLPQLSEKPEIFFGKLEETVNATKRARGIYLDALENAYIDVSRFEASGITDGGEGEAKLSNEEAYQKYLEVRGRQ